MTYMTKAEFQRKKQRQEVAERQRKKRIKRRRKRHKEARVELPNEEGFYPPKPRPTKADHNRREKKLAWLDSMERQPVKSPRAIYRQGLPQPAGESRRRDTECPKKAAAYDRAIQNQERQYA